MTCFKSHQSLWLLDCEREMSGSTWSALLVQESDPAFSALLKKDDLNKSTTYCWKAWHWVYDKLQRPSIPIIYFSTYIPFKMIEESVYNR